MKFQRSLTHDINKMSGVSTCRVRKLELMSKRPQAAIGWLPRFIRIDGNSARWKCVFRNMVKSRLFVADDLQFRLQCTCTSNIPRDSATRHSKFVLLRIDFTWNISTNTSNAIHFFVYGLVLETGPPVLLWNHASSFIDENDHLSIKNCPTIRNLYIRECYPCEYTNNITVKELTLSVIKGVIT